MMKEIATCLLVALLTTGVLVSSSPVFISYASSNESENSDSGEESSDESGGDETKTEPEPEPEPEVTPTEPEPEPETPPKDNTCQGGPPGIDGCPPEEEPEPKVKTEIEPCLLDPSLPSCPKPGPNQDCPEGWAQNEDGNCFPLHPQGCPSGYHGHEDDETGRCIPNSTPCDPGYEFNEDHTNCERPHFTCDGKPSVVECKDNNHNGNHNDHDKKIIIVKKIIKNIDIINKIDNANSDGDLDVAQTIVAINYNEGAGINCVFDEDDNGQCETFDVNKDAGKEPLLQIIDFD